MIDENEDSKLKNDINNDNLISKKSSFSHSIHSHINSNNDIEKSSEKRLNDDKKSEGSNNSSKKSKKDNGPEGGNNDNKKDKDKDKNKKEKEKNEYLDYLMPNFYLIYQEMIVFHRIYTYIFFVCEILIFVYKGVYIVFPRNSLGVEITCLFFYLFIQLYRFNWGTLGNRTQTSSYVLYSMIWSLGAIYTYVHFHLLQTFVLNIELVFAIGGIICWLFEIIFAVLVFLKNSEGESEM